MDLQEEFPTFVKVKQYSTVSVEEDRIFPRWPPGIPPKAREDIQAVYPVGMPAQSAFAQAHWLLEKNGTVVVQLPQPGTSGSQTLTLSGAVTRQDGAVRLQATGQGARGLATTLDGLLIASDDGYRLKCVYTAQIRGARHIELLTLRLSPAANPLPLEFVERTIVSARHARVLDEQKSQTLLESSLFSEPETAIGGIPVPMDFAVTVRGKVDDVAFGPMKGTLLLRQIGGADEPAVRLLLAIDDHPAIPGWSFWDTHVDGSPQAETSIPPMVPTESEQKSEAVASPRAALEQHLSGQVPSPGVSVTAEGGRLYVEITPAPPFRTVSWFSHDPDHPEDLAQVHVDTGKIDLRIHGDEIFGTIEARGHVLAGNRPVSTFRADVEGRRHGSELLETITDIVGPRRFSGQWQALWPPQMGQMHLTQDGPTVQGDFTRGGAIINGTVTSQILNFDWSTPDDDSGQGFIRAAGSGLLVGMKWPNDAPGVAEPIVAEQEQPAVDAQGIAGEYLEPTTDEDDGKALALRFLGQDLAQADKHREAAKVLTKVIHYYSDRANSAVDPEKRYQYLLSQGMPILTLVDSAFKAGEYHLLIEALDSALEMHRGLSPDISGRLLFRTQAQQYVEQLSGTAETMGLAAGQFDRALYAVTGAGIGARLEELPNAGGVKITRVDPGMPAGRAGVMEGDQLVAIDGATTASMNMNEIFSRLRGQAGSVVTLTLLQGGRQREVELVREPLTQMEPKRREDLAKALTGLRDQAATLQHKLTAEAEAVHRLSKAAAKPQSTLKPVPALEDLMARITKRRVALPEIRVRMIALAEEAMADTPKELNLFRRFVALLQRQAQEQHLDAELSAAMMTLDQEFEEVERRGESGDLDAGILVVSSHMVGSVIALEGQVADRHQHAAQARKTILEAPIPNEIQERLAFFIGWLDRWWSQLVTDPGKIDALHSAQKVYDRYVQLLVEFNLPEKALEASEVARARAFRDLLASRRSATWSPTLGEGAALASLETADAPSIEEMRSLVQETSTTVLEYYVLDDTLLIWVLAPTKPDAGPETVAVHLHEVKISRVELQALVEQFTWLVAAPTGAETPGSWLKRLEGAPPELRTSHKLWSNAKEWFKWLGEAPPEAEALTEQVTRRVMTPSGAEMMPALAETATVPRTLYTLLETETATVLQTLYAKLIAPLTTWLPEQSNRPVTIVPHDILFRIPFAALARPPSEADSPARYLVKDHALAYAPSLGIMQMVRQLGRNAASSAPPSLLAVVNPVFGPELVDSAGHPFRTLPQLEADIGHVLKFYEQVNTRLLPGMEATPEAVLAEAPSYDVVLFATHAEALEKRPMDSYLALAGDLLRVEDIAYERRRLKARLVILGACETGLGAVTGDGVEGLARWMMAAGANAMMTSLWKVPEQATLELLYAFHRAWLQDGMDMTAALREAQLELLTVYPGQVPLWAGFIMIGGWP